MSGLTTLTWKSVTVLPPLIGVSIGAVLSVALIRGMSLQLGAGLLVCALAFTEIGYLSLLILANRRDAAHSVPIAPEP